MNHYFVVWPSYCELQSSIISKLLAFWTAQLGQGCLGNLRWRCPGPGFPPLALFPCWLPEGWEGGKLTVLQELFLPVSSLILQIHYSLMGTGELADTAWAVPLVVSQLCLLPGGIVPTVIWSSALLWQPQQAAGPHLRYLWCPQQWGWPDAGKSSVSSIGFWKLWL